MSVVPDPPAPEGHAASPATSHIREMWKKRDEEIRNAPVPCQWPDTPTSALAATDVNDPVQPSSALSADQQVEYGILSLNFSKDPERAGRHGAEPQLLTHHEFDISLVTQPCEAFLLLLLERYTNSNQSPGEDEDAVMDLGSVSLGPFTEPCTKRMGSCTFKDATVRMDMTVSFSRARLHAMTEDVSDNRWIRASYCDLGGLELVEAKYPNGFYLMATISAEDYREGSAKFSLDNPWTLPVRFVYKSYRSPPSPEPDIEQPAPHQPRSKAAESNRPGGSTISRPAYPAERGRKILTEELKMPTYIQGGTVDVIRRLLEKNPAQRLEGVRGVSEIKEHGFFTGIDWQHPNTGSSKPCPFQPDDVANVLGNSPSRSCDDSATGSSRHKPPRKIRESAGYLHEEYDFGAWVDGPNPERIIGRPRRSSASVVFNPLVSPQEVPLSTVQEATKALQPDSEREGYETEAVMARLKAALQTKQNTDRVAHILDGCDSTTLATVLKSPILLVNDTHIGAIAPEILTCNIPITALEWTVEIGRADLVLLLLDRGADPNCTFDERYGPALIRAGRERSTEIVEILGPKTSRFVALRTLCQAVEQRDIPTIKSLLSNGVPCDFDPADSFLPPPRTSRYDWYHGEDCDWSQNFEGAPEPTYHLPPIVRAARHGDAAVVRFLLNHGADPNAAYHSLTCLKLEWHATWQEEVELKSSWNIGFGFSCGRVAQLAMQLGHQDVVDALLEGGANMGFATWSGLFQDTPVPWCLGLWEGGGAVR
ncbi:hypothetical protein CMUS01_02786 [Colletotrichum musicola]|uniref:Protein kinase domain-containing protein n=1 Tax=Colletotrichum musicola TaxID=2175873 RepID=A0A8H6NUA1_9PEZI|nr:hypothetical protein CMUS01_02786 [Colletotrichum musicola]